MRSRGAAGKEEGDLTDNELLLAISNIVEVKVGPLKSDMRGLKEDVMDLKEDVMHLKGDVMDLKGDVMDLKGDVKILKGDVMDLKEGLHALDQRVRSVEQEQRSTNLILENDVLPRLQTIEACYTSTYQRYADGISDIDSLKRDMVIVKKVVAEHSDRLQKIS